MTKKRLLVFAVSIILISAISLVVYNFSSGKPTQEDPISESIKEQVDYTLYYPARLPADFRFDDIAFDEETTVLTYRYSSGDKTIFFSLQEKPDDLNYDEFRDSQMTGLREIDTSLGVSYAGTLQDQTVTSMLVEDTWIFITAGPGTTIDDLEQASKSLAIAQ